MMIDERTIGHTTQFVSLVEYAANLTRSGVRIIPGGPGTFWARFDSGTMMRRPAFHLGPPTSHEIRQVLWRGRAAIASYLLEPDESHPANTWLYICTDQAYALEKFAPAMRRNVRRGLKELAIAPLTLEQVLAHGVHAFCDTRRRLGLSDGTPERFRRHFTGLAGLPERVYLGAWKDDQLVAFLSITEVDDWAEIDGCFSVDAFRHYRPNDTLMYSALSHYLVERKCHLVSYGLSSVQAKSNAVGLHRFKMKVGFEARPVHRAFVPHPLLRPFVNKLTLWGVNAALQFWPRNLGLKIAGGVLASMLGDTHMPEATATSTSDE